MQVRFDDLVGGESLVLVQPLGTIKATKQVEVAAAIAAAEAAAHDGHYVAGFVCYEAAPAFDSALVTRRPVQAGPPSLSPPDLPFVWFGVFGGLEPAPPRQPAHYEIGPWQPTIGRPRYGQDLAAIRSSIRIGDTYQVNHTFRMRAPFAGAPAGLYHDLCLVQETRYAALLELGELAVVSASPELFFATSGRRIVTRPMKGTARRGRWSGEDQEQRRRLIESEKQQAENVMIVDLLRNDLGRVAEFGSVRVEELFTAERYHTLWQLTSTISALAKSRTSLVDIFTALFPCGSVTGAPKPRTMEIIAQRETTPRGIYTGAVGLIRPNGDARFAVGIRTVVIRSGVAGSGAAEYGVGSGITWDSSSADEYEEALLKTKVLTERPPEFDLVETMRYEPGIGIDLLHRHLARLRESAAYFGFEVPADIDQALGAFSADRPRRVRLALTKKGHLSVEQADLPPPSDPVTLAVAWEDPIDPDDRYLFHKTSRRELYERRRQLHPDQTDVVLVNTRGEVTESTIANLAVLIEGCWYTPPLESGCLPGIRRGLLIEQGQLIERVLTVEEVAAADQIALVSSLRGWRPAKLVKGLATRRH